MMNLLNRKEIYLTYSMNEQSKIRNILSQNNIEYYIKTIIECLLHLLIGNKKQAGSYGQSTDLNYEYIIYVHKKDYEQAKYAIGK